MTRGQRLSLRTVATGIALALATATGAVLTSATPAAAAAPACAIQYQDSVVAVASCTNGDPNVQFTLGLHCQAYGPSPEPFFYVSQTAPTTQPLILACASPYHGGIGLLLSAAAAVLPAP